MTLSTGTILAGRYEITAPIATGGMGEVWRARDRVLDRVVAAKVLRSEFTGDPSFVARFRNEARHTAALSHPNIASVYDYGETEDERGSQLAFLVMELVEGKPLVTILHEEGKLPFDGTSQVAVALAHINRPPPPLPANVPPAVRQLIERALAKDPADRFADGAAFAAAIRSVASGNGLPAGAPVAAPGTTPPYPLGAAPTAQTEVVDDLADSRTQVLGAASAGGAAATGARTSVGAMPPLRRTEDDDEDGRYAARPTRDDGRRRNRWLWLVAGLVLLALLGGGLWALLGPGSADSPATDAAPSTSAPAASAPSAAGTVFVDSTGYIGDPVDDVEQLLTGQGLQVTTEEASAAQLAELAQTLDEGDVVTTDPFDVNVAPDSTVTLYYAPADYAPDTGDQDTGDQDQVPADPTTAAPTRTTAAPAPS